MAPQMQPVRQTKTLAHTEEVQSDKLTPLLEEVLKKTELRPYDAGRFAPRDAGELWDLARDWYWSELLPESYYPDKKKYPFEARYQDGWAKRGIARAVIVMRYGASLGVLPEQSVRQIYIVEGQPSPSAALMLSMAFAKGLLKREDWRIVEASKLKVVVEIFGSTRGAKVERVVAEYGDYKHLHGKTVWQQYPEDMLLARATSRAMRRYFPDVYAGVYATEERIDMRAERAAGVAPDDAVERIMAAVGDEEPLPPPPAQPQGETPEEPETPAADTVGLAKRIADLKASDGDAYRAIQAELKQMPDSAEKRQLVRDVLAKKAVVFGESGEGGGA